jgi:hypothetical protein
MATAVEAVPVYPQLPVEEAVYPSVSLIVEPQVEKGYENIYKNIREGDMEMLGEDFKHRYVSFVELHIYPVSFSMFLMSCYLRQEIVPRNAFFELLSGKAKE